jgi:hypothetical protein
VRVRALSIMPRCVYVPLATQALEEAGVRYVVAPYEADAQLAYMSVKGMVDVVITEDSDAIPYGCRRVRCRPRAPLALESRGGATTHASHSVPWFHTVWPS